jgi:tetratricopeptide (TPR) repeat protein
VTDGIIARMVKCLLWTALVLAAPLSARAQSDEDRARLHYETAVSYFEQARYRDAAREFLEAYRLSDRSHLLKNVATALEQAGEHAEAVGALEAYLAREPDAEDRRTIEERIAQLRSRAETGPPPDGEPDTPPDTPPDERPDAGASDEGMGLVPGLAVLGGSAAVGVIALVTGLVAHSAYTDLEAMCPGGVCPAESQSDIDSGETMAVVSTIMTGVAIAGGIAGAVLLILGATSGGGDDAEVTAGPGDVGGGVRVRF